MEKFIFLDVDGVLNNTKYTKKIHNKYNMHFISHEMPFDPKCLRRLSKIVHATGAKVILTSSWRKDLKCEVVLKARLKEYGVKIFDMLPLNTHSSERGHEIKKWLYENGGTVTTTLYADNTPIEHTESADFNYIIIDDYSYDLYDYFYESKIIMVSPIRGLSNKDMIKAIYKLNNEGD